jgi:hypothetical protein
MDLLPNEIIINITSYLSYGEITKLASLNRKLKLQIYGLDAYYLYNFIDNMNYYLDTIQGDFKITYSEIDIKVLFVSDM